MSFEKLTGKTAYRISLFRKLILQVEVTYCEHDSYGNHETIFKYRDANVADLQFLLNLNKEKQNEN